MRAKYGAEGPKFFALRCSNSSSVAWGGWQAQRYKHYSRYQRTISCCMYGSVGSLDSPQPYPPTSVVLRWAQNEKYNYSEITAQFKILTHHHGMPDMLACTPCGTCEASCSKELCMSLLQSTTPCRWPPAQTPRVSTRGGAAWPGCAATGSENSASHSLTQRLEYDAAGPYDVL